MKTVPLISALVFLAIALGHLLRLLTGSDLIMGGWLVPMWISVVAVIVSGTLAFLLWREQK